MGVITGNTIILSSKGQTVSYYAWISHTKNQRGKKTRQYNCATPAIEGKLEYKWEQGNGADWLTISPLDDKRVNLVVQENVSDSDRSVKIYLTGSTNAGTKRVPLTIKQEAAEKIPVLKLYLDGQESKAVGEVQYNKTGIIKAKLDGEEIDIKEVTLKYDDKDWYSHTDNNVTNRNGWSETDGYEITDRLFSVTSETKTYHDGDKFYLFSREDEKDDKPTDFYWDLSYTKKQTSTKNTKVLGTYTTSSGKVLTAELPIDFIGEKPIGRYFGENNKDNYTTASEDIDRLNVAIPAYEGNYNGIYRFSTNKCNETGEVRIKSQMIGRTFYHTLNIAAPDGIYIRDFVFKAADINNVFRFDVDKINATSVSLIEPTYRIYIDGAEIKNAKAMITITEGNEWVVPRIDEANSGRYYIKFNDSLTNDRTMVATASFMGATATTTIIQDRNKPFIARFEIPSDNATISLTPKTRGVAANDYEPFAEGITNIDWGDGSERYAYIRSETTNPGLGIQATHTYQSKGIYDVKLYQMTRGMVNAGGGSSYKLITGGNEYVTEIINGVPVVTSSSYAMSNLSNLTSVDFDKSRKMFSEMNIFDGDTNLTELIIPKYCWEMGFTPYSEEKGDVFSGSGIKTLIMEGYQPPVIDIKNNPNMLNSIQTILVPPSSLMLYRNFDGWKNVANKIQPNENYVEMMAAFNR